MIILSNLIHFNSSNQTLAIEKKKKKNKKPLFHLLLFANKRFDLVRTYQPL